MIVRRRAQRVAKRHGYDRKRSPSGWRPDDSRVAQPFDEGTPNLGLRWRHPKASQSPDNRGVSTRLSADLKLPGRGWLDFEITPLDDGRRCQIRQTATFDPRGVLGRAYWYAIFPVHELMFRGLLRRIAERATARTG